MQFVQRPAINYFEAYKNVWNLKQHGGSCCAFESHEVDNPLTGQSNAAAFLDSPALLFSCGWTFILTQKCDWLYSPWMRSAYEIFSLSLPPKFSTDEQFIYVNNQVVYFNSEQEV